MNTVPCFPSLPVFRVANLPRFAEHFWVDAAGPSKDKHLHEAVNDDGPTRTRDAPRTQDGSFMVEGEFILKFVCTIQFL